MLRLIIQAIKIYQSINKLFIEHGARCFLFYPSCNFYPSCSEYALESFKKHGFKKGLAHSASRIFKCHPWANPGVDLP